MKLRTIFELVSRSDGELQAILRQSFNELALSDAHSPERRNALATIENVQRVMGSRNASKPPRQ